MSNLSELYASGMSCSEISKLYGVSGNTVRRWLIEEGVKIRSIKEALSKYAKYRKCAVCEKTFRVKEHYNDTTSSRRKTCSHECFIKYMSKIQSEDSNSNWKGGHSQSHYQRICRSIKKPVCEICGATRVRLDTHHKDGNKKNNSESNIQVLCVSCHSKLHYEKGDSRIRGSKGAKIYL